MIKTWIIVCDYCGDKIDGKSEYFYETMHGQQKHFCAHCWSEHPVEVNICVERMGVQNA